MVIHAWGPSLSPHSSSLFFLVSSFFPRLSSFFPLPSHRATPRRSAASASKSDYDFQIKIPQIRIQSSHAEYLVKCRAQLVSKGKGVRLKAKWDIWKRFSEFLALDKVLRAQLGWQMEAVEKISYKRDTVSAFFTGQKLDPVRQQ